VPTLLILGKDSEVLHVHQGFKPGDEKEIRNHLDELLEE
jgi:hypothetical protein